MTGLQTAALLLFLLSVTYIYRKADIKAAFAAAPTRHAIVNATALLLLFWLFRLQTSLGPDIHFLLVTALTLTLGFRLATLCATLCLLIVCAVGTVPWAMLGVHGITTILIPVGLTYTVYALSFHRIPRNFLVYIFLCAFIPAALVLGVSMLSLAGYYVLEGIYDTHAIIDNYLMIIPLMLFPEALLNGTAITLLVVYKPEWVYTFHDKFYFDD
ncbi:hypothetical protein HHX48_03765 [Salinimonas sp. HHU 13199]|uniref:Molecular chaperone DnaJ n=1 Tax=Salinimonas profundi TaxID=2729140 RepID=A0ABR8LF20_9ALTE|nr:energy-coupling factor ABC transporter permease [Salinimonas profundi]MBD3584852.1 hypothetical protein [Salinimonas profundi]